MMANTMPTPHSPTRSSGLHFYAEPGVLIGMALRGMMK